MNEVIKWMWYADVVQGATVFCAFFAFIFFLIGVLFVCTSKDPNIGRARSVGWIFCWIVAFLMGITALFLPGRNTMYTIVASKASDAVVTSEIGQQAITVLKHKLADMVKDDK